MFSSFFLAIYVGKKTSNAQGNPGDVGKTVAGMVYLV
jgi:hypothetical protein